MSFQTPVREICKDFFKTATKEPLLVLTDQNMIVRLYGQVIYQVCTVHKELCQTLFGTDQQTTLGFLTHGMTGIPVKRPQIGQPMFFWNVNNDCATFSGQRVRRIYDRPMIDLVKDPWANISAILYMMEPYVVFDPYRLLITGWDRDDKYNRFFCAVLKIATDNIQCNGWILNKADSEGIKALMITLEVDEQNIFASGLIYEDKDARIVVSEALYALYMNAIHTAHPMATKFDTKGDLHAC